MLCLCVLTSFPVIRDLPRNRAKAPTDRQFCGLSHSAAGRRVVSPFADFGLELCQPGPRARTMDDAAQKSQCFGDVAAIGADVFLSRPNVGGEKGLHAPGFGKDIGRMAQLWSLDDHRGLKSKDVFVPEQIETPCAPAELAVEKVVVVGPPVDRCNIEVSRDSQVPANPLQVSPLPRFTLDTLADPGERVRELAETMIGLAGGFHLFDGTGGQLDGQATGQGSVPLDQLPLAGTVTILACLDE